MVKNLVIVGTGLFAQLSKDYFEEYSEYKVLAFACHLEFKKSDNIYGLPLITIEDLDELNPNSKNDIFVAIGYAKMNRIREKVYNGIKQKDYKLASFVHPDIKIWPTTKIGDNVFIFENYTIQPYTEIGSNTIMWRGNHLGHHSTIGKNCFISSHVVISGSCKIGNNVFVGVNATMHDQVVIGNYVMVGSDTSIHKSVPEIGVLINKETKLFPKNSDRIGV